MKQEARLLPNLGKGVMWQKYNSRQLKSQLIKAERIKYNYFFADKLKK